MFHLSIFINTDYLWLQFISIDLTKFSLSVIRTFRLNPFHRIVNAFQCLYMFQTSIDLSFYVCRRPSVRSTRRSLFAQMGKSNDDVAQTIIIRACNRIRSICRWPYEVMHCGRQLEERTNFAILGYTV